MSGAMVNQLGATAGRSWWRIPANVAFNSINVSKNNIDIASNITHQKLGGEKEKKWPSSVLQYRIRFSNNSMSPLRISFRFVEAAEFDLTIHFVKWLLSMRENTNLKWGPTKLEQSSWPHFTRIAAHWSCIAGSNFYSAPLYVSPWQTPSERVSTR